MNRKIKRHHHVHNSCAKAILLILEETLFNTSDYILTIEYEIVADKIVTPASHIKKVALLIEKLYVGFVRFEML